MNAAFVLDCSVTMTWCFPDEATAASAELLDRLEAETAVVPDLWFIEVANVLAMAERRRRISAAESSEFLARLETLAFEVDHDTGLRAFGDLLPLCRDRGLTAYDATYLDLALRRGLPLATLDRELRQAAAAAGVALLGL